jgi:acyl dehydratase
MADYTLATLSDFVGRELGVSDWLTVDQARIDAFADCTGDRQWIHVDPERARRGPFGTTIAHGFLTLSVLPVLREQIGVAPEGVAQVLNYGADRVRFLTPVKAGARIRVRVTLVSVEPKGSSTLVKTRNTVEIEGEDRPALIADTLALLMA